MSGLAVELRGIVKRYPRVVANDGVDLSVESGTIHALIGENGAGKSTLMKILYGMVRPDEGTLSINGKPADFSGPRDAIIAGIGMVHQHFMLVKPLSVAENVVLGSEPGASAVGTWDQDGAKAEVARLSKEYGVKVESSAVVETLSVGEEQRVEILKVLYRGAKILILDEPTAVLTPHECDELFKTLKGLRAAGSTILFISHKLKEVMSLCDAATVMRRGKTVGTKKISETSQNELAQMMIGDLEIKEKAAVPYRGEASEVLRLENVSVRGPRDELALKGVSLSLKAGEVLGVAGVEGNGQRELAEVVCGLSAAAEGRVTRGGRVGYVPEDRHHAGLMLAAAAWENMLLGRHWEPVFSTPFRLQRGAIAGYGRKIIADYDLRPPELEQEAGAFSGGNQQKIIVGREVSKDPKILVAAHPTRGVDWGASALIHQKILETKAAGAGVLLISADLDEVLSLSDRIIVLFSGRVMGEVARADAKIEKLGCWMAGVSGT
ncbi:MAG: ABC transporter ATP-binding protein [Elusimicrobia bacterium]|nr:ABC transporter ATP-binding protein [Elusimicrobiota bacterium]